MATDSGAFEWLYPSRPLALDYRLLAGAMARPANNPTTVRAALADLGRPVTAGEVAAAFDAAPVARVAEWLGALAALGQARVGDDGRYVAG